MYSTCLFCTKDLGANDVLETLPIGRRIAFDGAQGRLWVVCRHCAKWNLVPFDTRLESIDAAERLFHDTRMRFSTDNIGLARLREGLELVRIGPAQRPEFASWRYGEQYRRRRRRNVALTGIAAIGAGSVAVAGLATAAVLGGAIGSFLWSGDIGARLLYKWFRRRQSRVWVRSASGGRPFRVDHESAGLSTLDWDSGAARYMLGIPGQLGAEAWTGHDLRSNGRVILGAMNGTVGRTGDIRNAAYLLGRHGGDLDGWLQESASSRGPAAGMKYPGIDAHYAWKQIEGPYVVLAALPPAERLAVEMWMNEDIERTWLEGELKLLEREWQQAERLAKIADDLVVEPSG